jgi:hypothetical protein
MSNHLKQTDPPLCSGWLFAADIPGAPGMFFLARAETGEIASAGRAAIRSGATTQQDHCPARGMIILFAPGAQILAITAGTPGKSPRSIGPNAGLPTGAAFAAAQRVDSEERPNFLPNTGLMGDSNVACSALGTCKLHESETTKNDEPVKSINRSVNWLSPLLERARQRTRPYTPKMPVATGREPGALARSSVPPPTRPASDRAWSR